MLVGSAPRLLVTEQREAEGVAAQAEGEAAVQCEGLGRASSTSYRLTPRTTDRWWAESRECPPKLDDVPGYFGPTEWTHDADSGGEHTARRPCYGRVWLGFSYRV